MSTILAIVLLAAGIALVVTGAEIFFEGLLAVASGLRVSAFALTVVISGFELENLAAGIAADLKGLPGAAAGTFLGGTTFPALTRAGVRGIAAPRSPSRSRWWAPPSPYPPPPSPGGPWPGRRHRPCHWCSCLSTTSCHGS